MINLLALKGTQLRKDLKATRVCMSYHNKHKDGSGNFGFVIVFDLGGLKDVGCGMKAPNERWFQISGDYTPNKECYHLSFGNYSRPIISLPNEWSYLEILAYMSQFITKSISEKENINEG